MVPETGVEPCRRLLTSPGLPFVKLRKILIMRRNCVFNRLKPVTPIKRTLLAKELNVLLKEV